jgi:chromosome segregation ATPase
MSVDQQFNTINDKLQLLLKQYNRLQKENEKLKEEIRQAQLKEEEHLQQLEEIRQQVSIMKVSSGELGEKDKKDFEKKINQYIKEIDRCISFLSQ